jgi:hypothetical protein
LLSSFCFCLTLPSDQLSFEEVVSEQALESSEIADPELLPDAPLSEALLLLVVLPPVALAVLLLAELPLPMLLSDELPPAPPVATLLALPELPALAVDAPSPLEADSALPSL